VDAPAIALAIEPFVPLCSGIVQSARPRGCEAGQVIRHHVQLFLRYWKNETWERSNSHGDLVG
jgi:hypothetical protein